MFHFEATGTDMGEANAVQQSMPLHQSAAITGYNTSTGMTSYSSTCPITSIYPPIDFDTLLPLNYDSPDGLNYVDPKLAMQNVQHGYYGFHNTAPQTIGRNASAAPLPTSRSCATSTCPQSQDVLRNNAVRKPKRFRTAYTTDQIMALEQEYAQKRYLDRIRRKQLADILCVNERAIKLWFQNRRMKEKKERANSSPSSNSSTGSRTESDNIPSPVELTHQFPTPPTEGILRHDGVFLGARTETNTPTLMEATNENLAPVAEVFIRHDGSFYVNSSISPSYSSPCYQIPFTSQDCSNGLENQIQSQEVNSMNGNNMGMSIYPVHPNQQAEPQYYRNAEAQMLPSHPWQQAAPESSYFMGVQMHSMPTAQETAQESCIFDFNLDLLLN